VVGRHALALQQQGKHVVGLDPSPGAVEEARERGVAAEPGSIAHPPEGIGAFDTLLLLGSNLGLLQGEQEAPAVLRHLASLARGAGADAGPAQ
jgi:SAM-dependent methyltransferase